MRLFKHFKVVHGHTSTFQMSIEKNKKREAIYKDKNGRLLRFDGFRLTALRPHNFSEVSRALPGSANFPEPMTVRERRKMFIRRHRELEQQKNNYRNNNNSSPKTSNIFSKKFWTSKRNNDSSSFDFSSLTPPNLPTSKTLSSGRMRTNSESVDKQSVNRRIRENYGDPLELMPLPSRKTAWSSSTSSSKTSPQYMKLNPCMFFNSADPNDPKTVFMPRNCARKSGVMFVDATGKSLWTFDDDFKGYIPLMNLVGTLDPDSVAPDCCVIDQHHDHSSGSGHSLDCILFAGQDPNEHTIFSDGENNGKNNNNDRFSFFSHPFKKSKNAIFVGTDGSMWKLNSSDNINNYFQQISFFKISNPPASEEETTLVIQQAIFKMLENLLLTKSDFEVPVVTVTNAQNPNDKNAIFFPPDSIENTNNQYVVADSMQVFIFDGIEYVPLENDISP